MFWPDSAATWGATSAGRRTTSDDVAVCSSITWYTCASFETSNSRAPHTSSTVHGTAVAIPFFVAGVKRHCPTSAVASAPQTASEEFGTRKCTGTPCSSTSKVSLAVASRSIATTTLPSSIASGPRPAPIGYNALVKTGREIPGGVSNSTRIKCQRDCFVDSRNSTWI